jgi:hypothetical protein
MVDNVTAAKYKDKLAIIVNDVDLVPTLSVPNLYHTLSGLVPFFHEIDEATLIALLEQLLNDLWLFLPSHLFSAFREVIPAVVDAILGYSHGEQRLIRYPPGHIYQLLKGSPKQLRDTEIEPTISLSSLSLSIWAVTEHNAGAYLVVVDQVPNDQ